MMMWYRTLGPSVQTTRQSPTLYRQLSYESGSNAAVTIFSWLLVIVIFASYTINLIYYLTAVTVDRSIASLKEFSKNFDWSFAMHPGHGSLTNWKVSRLPTSVSRTSALLAFPPDARRSYFRS